MSPPAPAPPVSRRSRLRAFLRPLLAPLRLLRDRLRPLGRFRVELVVVEGRERESGLPLSVACVATAPTKSYLLDLVFGPDRRVRSLGRFWLWRVAAAIRRAARGCSLAFVETRQTDRARLNLGEHHFLPDWILGEVALPLSPSVLADDGVKSDLRRIRKHALEYEVTRDPARFEEFYRRMHVPFITRSHGGAAYLRSFDAMRHEFEQGELLLVRKGEQWIGGTIILHDGEVPRLGALGVTDGSAEYLRFGVVGATIHFGLRHLEGLGHQRVGLGMSRSFLRDGALRYKRKWGQRIVQSWPCGLALRILDLTPGACAFLRANPFVDEVAQGLVPRLFVEGEEPLPSEQIAAYERELLQPGLEPLSIQHLPAAARARSTHGVS